MKTTALAALALCTMTALTACGGDSGSDSGSDSGAGGEGGSGASSFAELDGQEIADASKEAMAALESVRVAGSFTSEGREFMLDVAMDAAGSCAGTVTTDGIAVEILGAGGETWIKPDAAFWATIVDEAQAAQLEAQTAGKWVSFGPGASGFEDFCDLEGIVGDDEDEETYETGEVTDVDGAEAVAVTSTDEDGEESIGYVLVDEPHHLVKVERTGEEAGTMSYTDFDVPVDAVAPAADEIVDLS